MRECDNCESKTSNRRYCNDCLAELSVGERQRVLEEDQDAEIEVNETITD